MKIILFLNKDLYANTCYNLLKKELSNHNVRVYYSDSVGNKNQKPDDLLRLEYFEKVFFYEVLLDFIETNQVNSSFEFFNKNFHSVPFFPCNRPNSPDFMKDIKAFKPDLFISIRYGKIFKDEIIKIPRFGLINLHSGILPDYRGILGTLHALKNAEKEIGCTLHTIPNSGIDTGEIIEIANFSVNNSKSVFWQIAKLYPFGCQLILNALEKLKSGENFQSVKQNLEEGNYYSIPTNADFDEVNKKRFNIITATDYLEVIRELILPDLNPNQINKLIEIIKSNMSNFKK